MRGCAKRRTRLGRSASNGCGRASPRSWVVADSRHTGEMYLAGQDPNQPLLAPAARADLTGFPPILLQVGTNELLLDDSVRLAERARKADIDVILDTTAGVPDVFQAFTGTLDEANQATDRCAGGGQTP